MYLSEYVRTRLRFHRWNEADISSSFLPTSLKGHGYKLLEVTERLGSSDPVILVDSDDKVIAVWKPYATLTDLFEIAEKLGT